MYIYIYIYIERERCVYMHVYIYIYIYIYVMYYQHTWLPGADTYVCRRLEGGLVAVDVREDVPRGGDRHDLGAIIYIYI